MNENEQSQSGLGIAGMVIGIVSLLLSCLIVGGFTGIVGLILSIVGVAQKGKKTGTAVAGIVLNAIAIIIMILIFAGVFSVVSIDDQVKKVTSSSGSETTESVEQFSQATEEQQDEMIFHAGETAEYNDIRITMTNVSESQGNDFFKPGDGNVFAIAEFDIENNSSSDLTVSSIMLFDAYQDGYATSMSLTATTAAGGDTLDGTLAPGKKMKGSIGYEIPSDYSELEIDVTLDVWSDQKIVFVYNK